MLASENVARPLQATGEFREAGKGTPVARPHRTWRHVAAGLRPATEARAKALSSVVGMLNQFRGDMHPQLSRVQLDQVLADLAPEGQAQFFLSQRTYFTDRPLWCHDHQPDKLMRVVRGLETLNHLPDKVVLFQLVRIVLGFEGVLLLATATPLVATGLVASHVTPMGMQMRIHRRGYLFDTLLPILIGFEPPKEGA